MPQSKCALLFVPLLCALIFSITQATHTQAPVGPPFALKQIGPNVWAAIANPGPTAGGNAGFVIGDDGVAVIDTFVTAEGARQLLAEIRKLTKLPIRFAINTHYHPDHVAGNGVFVEAGGIVLAHRNVRSWIHTESLKFFGSQIKPEQKAFIEGIARPTLVYDRAVDLHLGSREIRVRSFPGHTGGDSVVLIPDAKAAFGGDLFWRRTLPNLIDASTRSWIDTLDTLAKNEPGYTFVSGHGDVGNAQDVMEFRGYLATLRTLVSDAQAQGKSGDALAEAVMPAVTDKYGQWDFFKYLAKPNILDMEAELSGKKKIPQAPRSY